MFARSVLQYLHHWASKEGRKPLILRGARQIGKTTAVEMFAKAFDQYIYLNLDKAEDKNLFVQNEGFDNILAAIFFYANFQQDPDKRTLIFIDEIQNVPKAVEMMRYFYEQAKDLFVVGAGSLLETLIDSHISFPVGRVEYHFMYPLTFTEFLNATGETTACELMQRVPVPAYGHAKLLKLFHQYTLLGGMPEVIQRYFQSRYSEMQDLVALRPVYESLMLGYMDDVEKYAKNTASATVLRHAIQHVPLEAGKRIKLHGFGQSNYGSREMGKSLRTLEKAMLLHLLYPTNAVEPPAVANYKQAPKLQFLDTGLMNYAAGLQQYFFGMEDLNSLYQGRVAEHVVGQELIAHIPSMAGGGLHFWTRQKGQSASEVDFVVPYDRYLIPVEVKSGKSGSLRSLHQFMQRTNHAFAVRLYAGKVSTEQVQTREGKRFILLNLPYYLAGCLQQYLEKYMQT